MTIGRTLTILTCTLTSASQGIKPSASDAWPFASLLPNRRRMVGDRSNLRVSSLQAAVWFGCKPFSVWGCKTCRTWAVRLHLVLSK